MSVGPSLANGAASVRMAAKPRLRTAASPWYSPTRFCLASAAVRRFVGPAMWVSCHDLPRSSELANQTSAVRAASSGRSLRRSYHVIPIVPCRSIAIVGSNAYAPVPGEATALHVAPASVERETETTPEDAELFASTVT